MSKFTTRVQLNGDPDEQEYEKLHKAMKKKGFSRFITSPDNKTYRLPHAEYNRLGNVTIEQVRDDAAAAAKTVQDDFQVLVTEGTRAWQDLKLATAAEIAAG